MENVEFGKSLITRELADGKWHRAEDVRNVAKRAGIGKSDFKQVRRELGVKTKNNGDGTWSWRLEKNE